MASLAAISSDCSSREPQEEGEDEEGGKDEDNNIDICVGGDVAGDAAGAIVMAVAAEDGEGESTRRGLSAPLFVVATTEPFVARAMVVLAIAADLPHTGFEFFAVTVAFSVGATANDVGIAVSLSTAKANKAFH
jgi:hypothetical protein